MSNNLLKTTVSLTSSAVKIIVDAAEKKAREMKIDFCIAVVDAVR